VPDKAFKAQVDSIQPGSGARFSLLPPENAVGNFVKVVQRVPVKITFDEPLRAPHTLGPGMSVRPSVRISDFNLSKLFIYLIAGIVAIGVGLAAWVMLAPKAISA
jgi:membrane fusion protein (multidrug efflux system)